MITTRLLPLMGGIAFLAAAPAFAQTETKPADNGAGNSVNAPVQHDSTAAPAPQPMHHAERHAMRSSGKTDTSQDSAVDRLNDQSYQASQQGQTFNVGGSDTTTPGMGSSSASGAQGSSAGQKTGKM